MRNKPAASLGRLMAAAMIALSLVVLASGAAEATPAASCDENFRQMLEDRSDAGRVQDNAATYGLIPPNDAAAGMTCMDQAMGVTGRLGNIFSDRHDDAVPAANTVVFTPPLAYPDWGAGEFLIGQLSETLTPMLEVHMGRNFGGSIGSLMGFNVISPQFTGLIDTVMNFTGDIEKIDMPGSQSSGGRGGNGFKRGPKAGFLTKRFKDLPRADHKIRQTP
jgi:hypothetical protein